ncbi:MAG: hypothetical protein ACKOWK_06075 [Micrococcales bacterium]
MIEKLSRLTQARPLVLVAFMMQHLWLVWQGLHGVGMPMGDIEFAYHPWVNEMLTTHHVMGISQTWVYPYVDEIFMFVPHWLNPSNYQAAWLIMEALIDLSAMVVLLYWPRKHDSARVGSAWFWIFAQILMGPVSISRLDSISVAVATVGLVAWLRAKPTHAAVWFAIATWIKVWPITLLAATIAEVKKWKPVAAWGLGTGLFFLVLGAFLGSFHNAISFVTEQTSRGIQIESPWALPALWESIRLHKKGFGIFYDPTLKTFQVYGGQGSLVASLLNPAMYLALALTIGLGWWILRSVCENDIARRNEVFAWTVLGAISEMIVFNKVGSPQYYAWLIVPAILGQIERVPNWKIVTNWILFILGLTGLIYPILYDHILSGQPWATGVLTVRNLALVLLLVLVVTRLIELAREQLLQKRANNVLLN